jgi:N-acetylmuramoyl-L-alanine amidase
MQPLRRGDTGTAVAEIRDILAGLGLLDNTDPSGGFDDPTEFAVRHFQQHRGLSVDGLVGPETFAALSAARWRLGDRVLMHTPSAPIIGDDVVSLQQQLLELGYDLGRADHLFGPSTASALRSFQRDFGLRSDGICGPSTLRALKQLARRVVGGRPQLLRDMAAVATAGPNLPGKRIVIDPGHGGTDRGAIFGAAVEADIVWDVASRLEGRLQALGATALMTRGAGTGASDEDRAGFANSVDADLVLSLHVDAIDSPRGNGVAAYYFGTAQSSSWIGERLADLAQREIVARTGLLSVRTHAKTWSLLRLTRMPAVRLELGYLSSPSDRERLLDAGFRDTVAEALLIAVQRLYLPTESDQPTGVMQISAVG